MKKLSALFVMIFMMLAVGVCAQAADLNISQRSFPNGVAQSAYTGSVTASGGTEPYTYSVYRGALPTGLRLNSATGEVTGTPKTSGRFPSIYIRVTDSTGASYTKKLSMYIEPREIEFNLGKHIYTYSNDVESYEAELTCITDDSIDYTVTYGADRLSEVTAAGIYLINISAPGCVIKNIYDQNGVSKSVGSVSLTVYQNSGSELSIQGKSVTYDGNAHGLTADDITVTPSSLPYSVTYRKSGESAFTSQEPVDVGTYTAFVETTDTNYEYRSATATITISYEQVAFNVSGTSFTYDGNPHAPTVTPVNPDGVTYSSIKYVNTETGTEYTTAPSEVGTYRIELTFDGSYEATLSPSNTFTISPSTVNFTVSSAPLTYNTSPQYPDISNDKELEAGTDYTVKYYSDAELTQEVTPTDAGTYYLDISLTHPDDYEKTVSSDTFTINQKSVTFTVEDSFTYTGSQVTPSVTNTENWDSGFTVSYLQSGSSATLKNVGTYDVNITLDDGYTKNYTVDNTNSTKTVSINKNKVNFTVTDYENHVYDTTKQSVTVTASDALGKDFDAFTVSYTKDGQAANPINSGTYDIVITLSDTDNYEKGTVSPVSSFTIQPAVSMSYGNSPAALIMKDTVHDDTWKTGALTYFRTNHSFDDAHLPENANKGITYTPINGTDYDGDEHTVIVRNLSSFSDPGFTADGQNIQGVRTAVDGVDGLYKLTYTYGGNDYTRYILVVGNIGDANGDGVANGIDSNVLNAMNKNAQTVTEARVMDVNMDGKVNKADAAAIRKRFSAPLTDYYPWVNN